MEIWIKQLQHPLVVVGFGLFIFALIIKPLFLGSKKVSGAGMERLLHKGMILLFILAVMAVAGGITLSWKNGGAASGQKKAADKPAAKTEQQRQAAPAQVKQETKGEQSPAVNAQGDVEINYGK